MAIRTLMDPNKTFSKEEFLAMPGRVIALDGAVAGPYLFDPNGPKVNFNHHEGCPRLVTRATCAQVLMYARSGLYERFVDKHNQFDAAVPMNDCDNDVSTSYFILKNPAVCRAVINPRLNKLVGMEDLLDTTAGNYAFPPDIPGMEELNWIFDPYWRFRLSGRLDKRIAEEFLQIIDDVHLRINSYLFGDGGRIPLDTRFEVLGGGPGWQLVKEIGAQARAGLFASGAKAFVAVRERSDGRYVYTFGRQSDMVPFPLDDIYYWMNELEGCIGPDRFGGGDTIGGSPRSGGSKTPPAELIRFLNERLTEWRASLRNLRIHT